MPYINAPKQKKSIDLLAKHFKHNELTINIVLLLIILFQHRVRNVQRVPLRVTLSRHEDFMILESEDIQQAFSVTPLPSYHLDVSLIGHSCHVGLPQNS